MIRRFFGTSVVVVLLAALIVGSPMQGATAVTPWTWQSVAVDQGGATVASGVTSVVYRGQLHLFTHASSGGVRHLWFDGQWLAETLDSAESSGNYVAAAVFGSQLHVFNVPTNSPGIRHLWFDDSWRAETLDNQFDNQIISAGYSAVVWTGNGQLQVFGGDERFGGIRHGWYDAFGHWNFQTMDITPRNPVRYTAALTYDANGDLEVFATLVFGGVRHGWYDGTWHFEAQPLATSEPSGAAPPTGPIAATNLDDQLQVLADNYTTGIDHLWFDGAWHGEQLDAEGSTGTGLSTTVFAFNDQIQVFGTRGAGAGVRHGWYEGGWHFEDLASDTDATRTTTVAFADELDTFAPMSFNGVAWLTYSAA